MGEKTPAQKAHVKPGTRVAIVNRVADVVEAIGLPPDTAFADVEDAELVVLFLRDRAELESLMRATVARMPPDATLWVCFRKGSASAGLDMNRNDVWAIAEELDLRPLGLVSLDESWSAFRLRRG